jgi:hypothetical protein
MGVGSWPTEFWSELKESWCPKGMKQELTSYHLKNILFWECENHPYDYEWQHDQLATRIVSMCYLLVSYIQSNILPSTWWSTSMSLLPNKLTPVWKYNGNVPLWM